MRTMPEQSGLMMPRMQEANTSSTPATEDYAEPPDSLKRHGISTAGHPENNAEEAENCPFFTRMKRHFNHSLHLIEDWVHHNQNQTHHSVFSELYARYLPGNDAVYGLDIGEDCITLCRVKMTARGAELALLDEEKIVFEGAYQGQPVAHLGQDGAQFLLTTPYISALQRLAQRHHLAEVPVAIAVPCGRAVVKTVTLPLMTEAQIEQAIALGSFWQNLVDIPGDPAMFHFHYEIVYRDEEAQTVTLLIAGAERDVVEHQLHVVKQAGLQAAIVDIRCFAMFHALHHATATLPPEVPTAFVSLRPADPYLHIYDDGSSYLYPLMLGREQRAALPKITENATLTHEIAAMIQQILSGHAGLYDGGEVQVLSLYQHHEDDGALLPLLTNLLPDVQVVSRAVTHPLLKQHGKPLTTANMVALGLAMRHFDPFDDDLGRVGEDNVNVLPNIRAEKQQKRSLIIARMLLVILMIFAGAGAATTGLWLEKKQASLELAALKYQLVELAYPKARQAKDHWQKLNKQVQQIRKMQEVLVMNQPLVMAAYEAIGTTIPDGVWLDVVQYHAPNQLAIEGKGMSDNSILEFIRLLNQNALFHSVSLRHVSIDQEIVGTLNKEFTILAELDEAIVN